jgi:hypothetical protein
MERMPRKAWVDDPVLTVVLVIVAVAGVWGAVAMAFALLAGGVIHARDHQDAPYGGFQTAAPVAPLAVTNRSS